eukprot:765977-Hanusia_phi.AAC.3
MSGQEANRRREQEENERRRQLEARGRREQEEAKRSREPLFAAPYPGIPSSSPAKRSGADQRPPGLGYSACARKGSSGGSSGSHATAPASSSSS